ncbi:YkuS family protein [Thermohalobacter berrensis]|uniref:YkuS family protein n=1 Tax=Thermohalobacter berrensis TaxID=99594 RepID=A0A419T2J5_9FIRM|nr:YkuS family protein [Thermohalobacter berrensis]RKD31672.1 hypothetical protein BET03_12300 [Thermohalobacter berrensis]
MSKKIAVQGHLNEIKENLIRRGYEVFDINENRDVEAIIYMSDGHEIPYYGQVTNMDQGEDMTGKGAILINANGKSIEEIEYIINNRIYSPLF